MGRSGLVAYTLAYVGFAAIGVVLQTLGVNVRHPLVTAVVVPIFILAVVGLARLIHPEEDAAVVVGI